MLPRLNLCNKVIIEKFFFCLFLLISSLSLLVNIKTCLIFVVFLFANIHSYVFSSFIPKPAYHTFLTIYCIRVLEIFTFSRRLQGNPLLRCTIVYQPLIDVCVCVRFLKSYVQVISYFG